jgi:stage II sporulation protein P
VGLILNSYEKKPAKINIPGWFIYGTLGVIFMLLGMFGVMFAKPSVTGLLSLNTLPVKESRLFHLDTQTSRFLLKNGIPILENSNGEDDPFTILNLNWSELYWWLAGNIKTTSPREILKAQFPLLALTPPQMKPIKIIPPQVLTPQPKKIPETPKEDHAPQAPEAPVFLIYHTHTSESYLPVSGKDHVYPKGDIVLVGKHLQQVLAENYHVSSIDSEEVHDQIPFRESYQRSQITAKNYLAEYPSIRAVLDIHRDATPGIKARCVINNQSTATISIIVGSDKMGLPHPHWKTNYQFATRLADNMNLYYPGLNSRVLVSDARYNQHLHDHALIIEVGDQNSTMEEAYRAVELLAGVLVITLNQEAQNNDNSKVPEGSKASK